MPLVADFDPVALTVLGWPVRWYGLAYAAAFLALIFWTKFAKIDGKNLSEKSRDRLFLAVFLGVVLGGRIGFALFYAPDFFVKNPAEILAVWRGGMSFHGGLLGVAAGLFWFSRAEKIPFLAVADFLTAPTAIALALGRAANFVNGELWGRPAPTGLPWAMIFPRAGDGVPRHPSTVYGILQNLALGAGLFFARGREIAARRGFLTATFLTGYGAARFFVEFFREPEIWVGPLTMGQTLCAAMVLAGIGLFWKIFHKK